MLYVDVILNNNELNEVLVELGGKKYSHEDHVSLTN